MVKVRKKSNLNCDCCQPNISVNGDGTNSNVNVNTDNQTVNPVINPNNPENTNVDVNGDSTNVDVDTSSKETCPCKPDINVDAPCNSDVSIAGKENVDYNKVIHKPSINDVILKGNKTSEELGLVGIEELDKLGTELNINYTKLELKNIKGEVISEVPRTFIFEQGRASKEWVIEHDLDKYPSVTVVDSSGNIVEVSVEYITRNKVILKMNAMFSGKAFLN